ncbi:barstar family protein [Chitinimonas sp.]|uniref:barstar family protein n=1 Tax=Chitinimonas sp. TaxID=1934313 RepID=UPI002F92C3BE
MHSYTIDCVHITDESAFWQAYLAATNPEGAGYFGRNLDAFWDALNGGPGWPGECQLKFVNTASLKVLNEGRFYVALQEIARDSELVEVRLE